MHCTAYRRKQKMTDEVSMRLRVCQSALSTSRMVRRAGIKPLRDVKTESTLYLLSSGTPSCTVIDSIDAIWEWPQRAPNHCQCHDAALGAAERVGYL